MTKECKCVKNHNPNNRNVEVHHIWPKADGGPTVAENLVPLCATTHNNVHLVIEAHRDGKATWTFLKHFNKYTRDLGLLGWYRIKSQSV